MINLSIWLIKHVWQSKIGQKYNKKYRIICRYYPTCSEYATLALKKYGLLKGWLLTVNRIKRCITINTASCVDYP